MKNRSLLKYIYMYVYRELKVQKDLVLTVQPTFARMCSLSLIIFVAEFSNIHNMN
jgi:hypothetical protein